MNKIYIAIKHIVHFDWERTEIIGASFDERVCEELIRKDESEFVSFDDEYAEYWTESVHITKKLTEVAE